eukprot:SAG22_NODE_37_length_26837_cov_8.103523_15_plen_126_part_00
MFGTKDLALPPRGGGGVGRRALKVENTLSAGPDWQLWHTGCHVRAAASTATGSGGGGGGGGGSGLQQRKLTMQKFKEPAAEKRYELAATADWSRPPREISTFDQDGDQVCARALSACPACCPLSL